MSVFSDAFTGSVGTSIETHDANWTRYSGSTLGINSSNQCAGFGGLDSNGLAATAYFNGTLGADHYAQANLEGDYPALWVGFQKTTNNGYVLVRTGDVYKIINGALGSPLYNIGSTAGKLAYLQKTESGGSVVLQAMLDGAAAGAPYTDSSSPHTGGTSGIFFYGGAGGTIDNFDTGNVTGGGGGSNWGSLLAGVLNRLIQD